MLSVMGLDIEVKQGTEIYARLVTRTRVDTTTGDRVDTTSGIAGYGLRQRETDTSQIVSMLDATE